MNYTVLTTRIDTKTKQDAMKTADALGMQLGSVIKALLKQFIRTKSLTFPVREEIPNASLRKILKQAEINYKKGNTSPALRTSEEAVQYLKDHGI